MSRRIAVAAVFVAVLCIASTAYAAGSWSFRNANTVQNLNGVDFFNNSVGYVVGSNAVIRKTTDGGATWATQFMNPMSQDPLLAVRFVGDTNHVWAVGTNGRIFTTSDGGLTPWVAQVSGVGTDFLADVDFVSLANGFAVGESGWITHYNGFGWTAVKPSGSDLHAIDFVDASHAWVVGNAGTILFWNGAAWAPQDSGSTRHLHGVAFSDTNNGWAVGEKGTVLRTTDGGTTWIPVTSGTTATLESIALTDATHGTIVGTGGVMFTIADGALYLSALPSLTGSILYDIDFTDANHGWAVGMTTGGQGTVLAYTVPTPTQTTITSKSSVAKGKTLRISGLVSPNAAPGAVKITKTRLVGKKWKSAGTVTVPVTAGGYSYSFKPKTKGKWRFVAQYSGGALGYTNYAGSKSGIRTVRVK